MKHTTFPQEREPQWVLVDAAGQRVGRLASEIVRILRGKHRPDFAPSVANGDVVVVVNAEKVVFTGAKLDQKVYTRYSGYPSGLKGETARRLLDRKPERILEKAVWGMITHNHQGRRLIRRLKVYAGPNHPHQAQKPQPVRIGSAEK